MMKKAIILVSAVAFAAVPLRSSVAGDKEWATAGKVMVGLAALAVISDLVADQQPVYVSAPPPRRVIRVHSPRRVWVEGRYIEVVRKVRVPGYHEKVWVPPAHERVWVATRFGGHWQREVVRRGFYKRVWHPGHNIHKRESRWIPGHWEHI
ncbi:hypothetical protein HQ563_12555 [bacterium]|nr:hypothetical protein [bacterium]